MGENNASLAEKIEAFIQQESTKRQELKDIILVKIEISAVSLEQWTEMFNQFPGSSYGFSLLEDYLKAHQEYLYNEINFSHCLVFLKGEGFQENYTTDIIFKEAEKMGLIRLPVTVIPFLKGITWNPIVIITTDIHEKYLLGMRNEEGQCFLESYYKDPKIQWPAKATFVFVWPTID